MVDHCPIFRRWFRSRTVGALTEIGDGERDGTERGAGRREEQDIERMRTERGAVGRRDRLGFGGKLVGSGTECSGSLVLHGFRRLRHEVDHVI